MAKSTSKKAATKKAATKKAAVKSAPKKAAVKKAAAPPSKKAATSSSSARPAVKSAPKKVASSNRSNLSQGSTGRSSSQAPGRASGTGSRSATSSRSAVQLGDESSLLQELFYNSLKDIYWAEKALVKGLGKLSKAATSQDLKECFAEHLAVTNEQVSRLEEVFEIIGKKAQGKKCEAMEGLLKEADSMTEETKKGSKTRDVALIMASQKAEHYEIASYGSLATLAAQMGLTEAEQLLRETLQEEKDADTKLTAIAESHVNTEAEDEGSGKGSMNKGGNNSKENSSDQDKQENNESTSIDA